MSAQLIQLQQLIDVPVPTALKNLKGWLVWRSEQHQGESKPRKVPYYVNGTRRHGEQGTNEEKARLATFDKALASLQSGKWTGLGFAMLPEWGLVGLDFDACFVEGKLHPTVERIVIGTYAEISPSGKGVRAFMTGELADKKSRATDGQFGFEVFHAKGFLTITGNALDICEMTDCLDTVAPVNDAVRELYAERFNVSRESSAAGHDGDITDPLMVSPPIGMRLAELAELVCSMDPNCDYLTWAKVGMACHHERGGNYDGFLVWDEWSKAGGTYPGTAAMHEKWESFGREFGRIVTARWLKKEFNTKTRKDKLLLDPADVMNTARQLLDREFTTMDGTSLLRCRNLWYEHTGPCYVEKSDESLRAAVWNFLDDSTKQIKIKNDEGKAEYITVPFRPSTATVSSAIDAMKAVALVEEAAPPSWLAGHKGPDATEIVSMKNGLLHIPTRSLMPHSAGFFTLNTLPYDWQDKGEPTEWLKFLNQVWPDDQESQDTLQEIFGYLLTPDTSQQKIFMIIGPRRSGKGTIGRVLASLVGRNNIASPTLTSLTGAFGLQPLIDKLVALVPDARVSGQSNTQAIVERLLMVSGEDVITVDRKHIGSWTGSMTSRFVILTNETPSLGDASGALAGRFITLAMEQSFYGREDNGLTARLLQELPAIFRWALDGRDRLKQRGYFIQPESASDAVDELAEVNSPIAAFVGDCCDVGPAHEVEVNELFSLWCSWCRENGREHPGTRESFGKRLRASTSGVKRNRLRVGGDREYRYTGIRIKPQVAEQAQEF